MAPRKKAEPKKAKVEELPPVPVSGGNPHFLMEASFMTIACCLILLSAIFIRTMFYAPVCTNGPLLLQQAPPSKVEPKARASYSYGVHVQPGPVFQR